MRKFWVQIASAAVLSWGRHGRVKCESLLLLHSPFSRVCCSHLGHVLVHFPLAHGEFLYPLMIYNLKYWFQDEAQAWLWYPVLHKLAVVVHVLVPAFRKWRPKDQEFMDMCYCLNSVSVQAAGKSVLKNNKVKDSRSCYILIDTSLCL